MTGVPGIRRHSLDARAFDLVAYLEKQGTAGAPRAKVVGELDWTDSQFNTALAWARDHVCPDLGVAIPHPVPQDGWCYHLTAQWMHDDGSPAIEAGTSYAIGIIEARLRAVLRDVAVAADTLDSRSIDGRKANFMRKHLVHIVSTLEEIGPATGDPEGRLNG